ncbi:hypothetical protein C4K40_0159 [Pseudomonas sp. CMR5c]|nr:hypothetical protein C4K40_0159 [Pseudomonas sp. CMR5c]
MHFVSTFTWLAGVPRPRLYAPATGTKRPGEAFREKSST